MATPPKSEIILYDLACTKNVCFSPVVWRIRLLLNYKRISYKTIFLEFPDIEPTLKELSVEFASGFYHRLTLPKFLTPLQLQDLSSDLNLQWSGPHRLRFRSSKQVHSSSNLSRAIKHLHDGLGTNLRVPVFNLSRPTVAIDILFGPRYRSQNTCCRWKSFRNVDNAPRDQHSVTSLPGILPADPRGITRTNP